MGLALDIFFSALGSAYLIYGKREYEPRFLVAGFILLVYPYLVDNAVIGALIGVVVAAGPFVMAWL